MIHTLIAPNPGYKFRENYMGYNEPLERNITMSATTFILFHMIVSFIILVGGIYALDYFTKRLPSDGIKEVRNNNRS